MCFITCIFGCVFGWSLPILVSFSVAIDDRGSGEMKASEIHFVSGFPILFSLQWAGFCGFGGR